MSHFVTSKTAYENVLKRARKLLNEFLTCCAPVTLWFERSKRNLRCITLGLRDETKICQENTLTGPQLKIHCHGTLVQTSRRPMSEIRDILIAQSIHSIVSGSH